MEERTREELIDIFKQYNSLRSELYKQKAQLEEKVDKGELTKEAKESILNSLYDKINQSNERKLAYEEIKKAKNNPEYLIVVRSALAKSNLGIDLLYK